MRDTCGMGTSGDAIGVAVLGAGRMGRTHIRNLAGIVDARVVVVADPDLEAAERGRKMARAARAVRDPLEAIADPDVDAVVIVTPTSTHAALIESAVPAGRAVWSEKPIALDLAETNRVVEVVRRSGRPVQLGFMRRFDPGYAAARARIEAGELGRIELFRALSRDTYPPSVDFLRHSGGIFLDMAVHDLDLARFLVGEVDEVHSWASVLADERFAEADDFDTALTVLRFVNGALGVVETARHSEWGYDIRTEVAGARGKVVIEDVQKTHAHVLAWLRLRGRPLRELPRPLRGSLPPRAGGLHRGPPRRAVSRAPDPRTPWRPCALRWRARAAGPRAAP